jgi:hypothetical protein
LLTWAGLAGLLLEGAGIVYDGIQVPGLIDDAIIDYYGGPDGFMDETERQLMSDGGPLPRDLFRKARDLNSTKIDKDASGLEKDLHDRLQDAILNSDHYKEKRDFILQRLQEGTHHSGHIHVDFQDAGESTLGLSIGGGQLYYDYTEPPPKLKLRIVDSYDFTKKGHMWGTLQDDGYLTTFEVDVFVEEIPCPQAAPDTAP